MADYSLLGAFSTGGAKNLNAEMLTKLKDAEKKSVLANIDPYLEKITGIDAETKKALDKTGESATFTVIKAQALDLMSKISTFDLGSTDTNAFDAVTATTTGTSAVFDVVGIEGLQPGTNNIDITQLAQRDVFQSISFNSVLKEDGMTAVKQDTLAEFKSANISIDVIDSSLKGKAISKKVTGSDSVIGSIKIGGTTFTNDGSANKSTYQDLVNQINSDPSYNASIGTDGRIIISNEPESNTSISIESDTIGLELDEFNYVTHKFDMITDQSVTNIADVKVKSIERLATEINEKDEFIASIETVGNDSYRLVIKSAKTGQNNSLKITQNNMDLGLNDKQVSSTEIKNKTDSKSGSITVGSTTFTNDGTAGKTTYQDLVDQINTEGTYVASFDKDNNIRIVATNGYDPVEITNDSFSLGFDNSSHTQSAQNLTATVDGIDYNKDSNKLTIQGNLTMTAVEVGKSTINLAKDTSSILTGVEAFISSYNDLTKLITAEVQKSDSVMDDLSALRSMVDSIKNNLLGSYGKDSDLNLFNYGLELDLQGNLSVDRTKFGKALVDNYDDVKNLFLGNTADAEVAKNDSSKYLGMGTVLQDFLDSLDDSDGMVTRYEASITSRKEALEKERKEALESLDSKYDTMSAQFSQYSSLITRMEQSFSGLDMIIKQSISGS